jgi:hypothetical protein
VKLDAFRALVFRGVAKALARNGHCKGYEGAISVHFPSYLDVEDGDCNEVQVDLHCYVLGPSRHYSWRGPTLAKALDAAAKDVRRWIKELDRE